MKIIVTGHTSGIGEALLDLFSINKYDVYGISRNSSPKLEFSRQIELDLSREKDINLAYEWAKKVNPDLFFHCAGSNPITPLIKASSKVYTDCFNLHFLSASQICKGCIEIKKNNQFLKIFLISSIWSLISADSRGPYSISKSALNTFARQVAIEHGLNKVQALSIALGFVNTKLTNLTKNDERIINAKQRYLFSSDNLPTAKQVARILFDLSFQDLSLMNGNTLNLDGGILCQ
tara:strand:- start:845 stop:1546 length:702 start_codon:yes stop_codon:yes gene_type:complete